MRVTTLFKRLLRLQGVRVVAVELEGERQRLRLPTQPLPARAPPGPPDRAPLHPAPPAADKRESRALPTNAQTRMGASAASTAHPSTAAEPCHTGSTTTTRAGHTAHSAVKVAFSSVATLNKRYCQSISAKISPRASSAEVAAAVTWGCPLAPAPIRSGRFGA